MTGSLPPKKQAQQPRDFGGIAPGTASPQHGSSCQCRLAQGACIVACLQPFLTAEFVAANVWSMLLFVGKSLECLNLVDFESPHFPCCLT